jgi:hypothetical protein
MKTLKYLGAREAALILVPLIISGWIFYGAYLGSSYLLRPDIKNITSAPDSADAPLYKVRTLAQRLVDTDFSKQTGQFSLSPIDERNFLASFDNSETYKQFSEASESSTETIIEDDTPPRYKVSSIIKGEDRTFAVINGKIYRRGDKISENEVIARIDSRRILLRGKWGDRWIYVNF